MSRFRFASAISLNVELDQAIVEVATSIAARLGGADPDWVCLYPTAHYGAWADRMPELAKAAFGDALLFGCAAGGVIGGGREVEQRPALAAMAASVPGVAIEAFHLDAATLLQSDERVHQRIGVSPSERPLLVLLADPFTADTRELTARLDELYPESVVIGGLASGSNARQPNRLFLGDRVYRTGTIGLALHGNLVVDTIIAQGCRPIGSPMFVTRSRDNVILELDGVPATDALETLFQTLSREDQELVQSSLFLGLVMKIDQQVYGQGDFLIRNIVGLDSAASAIAVAAMLEPNQVVQFHLRDKETSADDLRLWLARWRDENPGAAPSGALMFSCLGRGTYLYGESGFETRLIHELFADLPIVGFFCNGEIGQVGGSTYLHGYTSALALLRPRSAHD
ncbi:MAG: FIST C-terminal domain-containing protein [Myxococcales bacterium]|nr:FIST C-terminal domain-containing protein [Myxococcales bacterium]